MVYLLRNIKVGLVVLSTMFLLFAGTASGQCDGNVPNLIVDLTSSPSATYLSPLVVRNGYCCGNSGNDRCLRFEITLHPDAQGFNFELCEGAVPGGALFYQIGCGPLTAVGAPICLTGVGPHILTFCKPGNNANRYCITSIVAPAAGPPITLNEGCSGSITSTGFAPSSVQWTSVFPGAIGAYNNYLSCPTCPTTNVTGQAGYPPYVDYRVCGYAVSPCSDMTFCDTVRVFFNSTLLAPILPAIPTVCFGATGTDITVNASGGTPPYSYLWSNGQTTPTVHVGPGTHTVQVLDGSNCPAITSSVTVTQFLQPIAALAGTDIVVCGASAVAQLNGSVTGVTTGIWSGGAGQFTPGNTSLNATYTPTAAERAAGFVDLVLTTTNNGTCPGHQDTVRVYFDPGIQGGTVSGVNATCNGVANGSATFTSPTSGLTYLWSNGQTSATATALAAGNYTVTASTALGCPVTLPVTISQPAALVVANMQVVNETCAGAGNGTVTANVTGGTAPYSYSWNVPGNGATITGTTGSYTVTVTDANGCAPVQATASIQANAQPNAADAGPDVIGCQNALPVALQGTVTNATGGYWSGGNGTFTGTGINVQYQPTQAEILSGSVVLTLTTTGNTSCATATDQMTLTLSNSFINANLLATNATCNGGQNGSVAYSPAAAGMTYQWQGFPQVTGPVASGLAAGTYQVQVTDQLGCPATFNATVAQPAALAIASMNVVNETCAGLGNGTATVNVTGGTPPYNYVWSVPNTGPTLTATSGQYTVWVSDANNCTAVEATATIGANAQPNVANAGPDVVGCHDALPVALQGSVTNATGGIWSGGSGVFSGSGLNVLYQPTTAEIQNGSVTLTLTTTGNTNCAAASDQMVLALSSSFISAALSTTNAACNGASNGSVTFSPAIPGNSYQWQGMPQVTGPVASGLTAGTYSLLVTDLLGCTATLNTTVGQPAALAIANMQVVNETCAGTGNGSATVTATGGTPPYSYMWSVPNTGPSLTAPAGQYTVSITDVNGCIGAQGTATINADAQPNQASAGPDLVACQGQYPVALQGQVTNATGGSWSGGNGIFMANGLAAQYQPTPGEIQSGSVTLNFTTSGNNNCPAATDQAVIQFSNAFLTASLAVNHVSCSGGSNGIIGFTPVQPGLTYAWQGTTGNGPVVNGLAAGTYGLTVTDALGCNAGYEAVITQPQPLAINVAGTQPVSCNGGNNGSATVSTSGGVTPYSYLWSTTAGAQTGSSATGMPAGTHTVTVTDANGCGLSSNVVVTGPAALTLSASIPDTVCVNAPVQLSAVAAGGTGARTILWAGIGTGPAVTHSFAGSTTVTVTVTDANNCTGPVISVPVTVLDLQAASIQTYGDTTVCPGGYTYVGAALLNYPGSHEIHWPQLGHTGSGPFMLPVTASMNVQVQVVDQCSQTITASIPVVLQSPPVISLPSLIARGCAPLSVQMPSNLTGQQVTYNWQFGNGTSSQQTAPTVVYSTPGSYTVSLTVTTPIGCSATAENTGQVVVLAGPQVTMEASPWMTDVDHGTVEFTAQHGTGIVSTHWTFGDGGTSHAINPAYTYTQVGTYHVVLQVQDANGCTNDAEGLIHITPVYDITVPNVFTPNLSHGSSGSYHPLDLSNDIFYPFIRFVDDYRMRVFNRWGELIFETHDIKRGWDGYYRDKLSPQDVYVYQLWVRFVDGKEKVKMGDITLMR